MTAPGLTRFAKIELAHLTQVSVGYAVRVSFHEVEDFLNPRHVRIVSILISSVKVDFGMELHFAGVALERNKNGKRNEHFS